MALPTNYGFVSNRLFSVLLRAEKAFAMAPSTGASLRGHLNKATDTIACLGTQQG
jgi:hypothetical protein